MKLYATCKICEKELYCKSGCFIHLIFTHKTFDKNLATSILLGVFNLIILIPLLLIVGVLHPFYLLHEKINDFIDRI